MLLAEQKKAVRMLERRVEAVEEASSTISLKKVLDVFSSVTGRTDLGQPDDSEVLDQPVSIPNTKEFFQKVREDVVSMSANTTTTTTSREPVHQIKV